jgi:uncharacterized protein
MPRVRPDVEVVLMARAPEPGRAKTRLVPRLGAEGAARLHAALVRHALREIAASGLPAALSCAPDSRQPFFAECAAEFDVRLTDQSDGDLGARMAAVFEGAERPTLLMGSDCPAIDASLLRRCAAALSEGANAVFLPAEDGGYGLVGLRRPIPEIFTDMPWGGPNVMSETRRRLRMLGIAHVEIAEIWDVDRPEDLDRLSAIGFSISDARD